MELKVADVDLRKLEVDALLIPVFEDERATEGSPLAAIDKSTGGRVISILDSKEIRGKRHEWAFVRETGELKAKAVVLYGAGKRARLDPFALRQVAGGASRTLSSRGISSAAFVLTNGCNLAGGAQALVEGIITGQMNSALYSSDSDCKRSLERVVIAPEAGGSIEVEREVETGRIMAEATNFARALGNEPGNVLTPTEFAQRAAAMAEREGLSAEILTKEEMQRLGMGALLAVSAGSEEPPAMIALTYTPLDLQNASGGPTIALVGKGVTFDSGGISIKPAQDMDEMKFDMCGGAAVVGAMQAIARLKPSIRVIGVVPASENLPSGRAYKPGDVIRSLSGQTIEIINTDAEGRLILADAITYAASKGATHIIDVATLTGACVVALGEVRAAVLGTDQQLIDDLLAAGEQTGERLWQMPLDKEYGELIRSDIADIKNAGNRTGGTITAAMFLKSFAGAVPWAHIDMAGTAWLGKAKPHAAKGATGFGVRTLANMVLSRSKKA